MVVLAAACNAPIDWQEEDAGAEPIEIHGRIVDFESCASWNRCTPVMGLRARLHGLPSHVSEPSDRPGRFEMPSPRAHVDDILVDPGARTGYAKTLNPGAAPAAMSDVYGVELYAMPLGTDGEGNLTILSALADVGIDLVGEVGEGGYIGQVLTQDEEGLHAVKGARVVLELLEDWPDGAPEPVIRYVNAVPRYTSGDIIYNRSRSETGPFGIFVIPTGGVTARIKVHARQGETYFSEVDAPVEPGMVTLGLHLP